MKKLSKDEIKKAFVLHEKFSLEIAHIVSNEEAESSFNIVKVALSLQLSAFLGCFTLDTQKQQVIVSMMDMALHISDNEDFVLADIILYKNKH